MRDNNKGAEQENKNTKRTKTKSETWQLEYTRKQQGFQVWQIKFHRT